MRRKDDQLWKGILEDVFDDFLRFLNPDVDHILDLNRGFQFLDKELEQVFPPENDEYSPKVVDKLVKVFTLSGKEEWVLIHLEVQGRYQKDFAHRMFTYFYRILDKYQKPITAYAIFTEPNVKERSNRFELEFMGTSLCYTYNTYKIFSQTDEALQMNNNPFALVVLIAKAAMMGRDLKVSQERDDLLMDLKISLTKQLFSREIPKEKIRVLMDFLKYYVRFENQNINFKFEQEVEILTERSITMGIEELLLDRAERKGIKKGIEEKGHKVVVNLITELGLSDEEVARIAEVSVDFVKKIRSKLKK